MSAWVQSEALTLTVSSGTAATVAAAGTAYADIDKNDYSPQAMIAGVLVQVTPGATPDDNAEVYRYSGTGPALLEVTAGWGQEIAATANTLNSVFVPLTDQSAYERVLVSNEDSADTIAVAMYLCYRDA